MKQKKGRKESTQKERTNHQYSSPSTNSVYVHESVSRREKNKRKERKRSNIYY